MKIILKEEQYEKLKNIYDWHKNLVQVNYYYDNRDYQMGDRGITIRVREINRRFYLQAKIPVTYKNSLHIKEEYEKEIDFLPLSISQKELYQLTGNEIYDVELLGKLETERFICNWKDDVEICLDKNKYLNIGDYELEIEYKGKYPVYLMEKLQEIGVYEASKAEGKFTRFIREYQRKDNEK